MRVHSLVQPAPSQLYAAENRVLLPLIPREARRFLDVGCGTGALVAAIQREHGGSYSEGITYSEDEARRAQEIMDRVWPADVNVFDFAQLGMIDCIICSHVLEHLIHPWDVLAALRGHLDRDGVLLVALPNALELKTRIEFLKGRFRYADGGILDRTHYRFFDWQTAYELVRDAGFEVDVRTATGFFPQPGIRRIIGGASKKLDVAAAKRFPGLFGMQFILRGRVKAT